jgi:hypothetical protein
MTWNVSWKKWPYWLKGAIIFGILFLPLLFITESNQWGFIPFLLIWLVLGYYYVSHFAFYIVGGTKETIGALTDVQRISGGYLIVLVYILLGAFLGWAYGKTKIGKNTNRPTHQGDLTR